MNSFPSINPLLTSSCPISNTTIGSIDMFGDIRGMDNRIIGRANMFGDVDLIGTNRTFAKIDYFGTLNVGVNQTPVGRISGSLPRPLLKKDWNKPFWKDEEDDDNPLWKKII